MTRNVCKSKSTYTRPGVNSFFFLRGGAVVGRHAKEPSLTHDRHPPSPSCNGGVYAQRFVRLVYVQRGAEFSAPEMEDVPGTTLIEVVLALSAWTLARAARGAAVAAPALAAVARNACPFLTAGMR